MSDRITDESAGEMRYLDVMMSESRIIRITANPD